MIQSLAKSNNTIIQICTEHAKPDREIIKSIAPKLSGLWSLKFNTSYIMKLPTTLVFTIFTENAICITKLIAQPKLYL